MLQRYLTGDASDYESWRPKRKAEFLAGRMCAHRCLKELGSEEFRIAFADDRSPIWPDGFVGSISHTDSMAVSAVTRRSDASGVGIDIQNVVSQQTAREISRYVLRSEEQAFYLARADLFSFEQFLTMVFAAKESVFKTIYPMLKTFFDFSAVNLVAVNDARLKFDLVENLSDRFQAGQNFDVGYRMAAGDVLTWLCLPPDQ